MIAGSVRGLRGGSWSGLVDGLRATFRSNFDPTVEHFASGFRVASGSIAAGPEPTSRLSMAGLIASSLLLRRRSKHSL